MLGYMWQYKGVDEGAKAPSSFKSFDKTNNRRDKKERE